MHWLLVATLSGAMVASGPRSDPSPARTAPLPRPTSAEIDLLLHAPDRRVRTTDARLAKMLAVGARRSETFAGLLAAIARTDVIVYIEPAKGMPSKLDGRLLLLPISNNQRYLRIQVRSTLSRDETVPLIGHELRHALEVAENPAVRDQAAMIELYERIGDTSWGLHAYDTAAARTTARQVKTELEG
jgi:hypothetical protein